ncbi:MAG: MerR family transcriptional regulator [Candidatus Eiseniibacteriota bacterium]
MKTRGWLTIGALARAAQIPAATLRTWERRYGVPEATRKPSGHRLYPPEAVDHLLAVRRALALGHRAAEVLPLSRRALESWLSEAGPHAVLAGASPVQDPEDAAELLRLASSMNGLELVARLRERYAALGAARFLDGYAVPFLAGLSESRRAGAMGARHEMFATARLADLLRELWRTQDEAIGESARRTLAAAAFVGDHDEMALLMGSLTASTAGWRVLYLGPGVAPEELATLAEEAALDAALVAIPARAPQAYTFALPLDLRKKLPPRTQLWTLARGQAISAPGVLAFHTFEDLARQAGGVAGAT